jgi:hypothetical protein
MPLYSHLLMKYDPDHKIKAPPMRHFYKVTTTIFK